MKKVLTPVIGLVTAVVSILAGLSLVMPLPAADAAAPPRCVVAHRGIGPENTAGGLNNALKTGACGFDFDVRFTSDSKPILNHDATLNRTTTGTGYVSQRPMSYIAGLHVRQRPRGRASTWHVSTLAQVLSLCRDSAARLCLPEIKKGATTAQTLLAAKMAVQVMGSKLYKVTFQTDTYTDTALIHKYYPQISIGYVGFKAWPTVAYVKGSGAGGIIVDRSVMSRSRVLQAAHSGLWVMPYTIESLKQLKSVQSMGAHGAMTDSTKVIHQARSRGRIAW